jgi:glycosyltransferase involved in cell wall biosynthesis
MIDLTIIIPVYNEIKTIEKLLNRVFKINIKKQIIVIDDASIDGTSKILKKYIKKIDKLITHKINKGKGAAIKNAQKYIRGKYTAIQDADLEYKPTDLLKILNYIKKKKLNVVYGSRVLNKNKFKNTKNFTHLVRIWGNIFLTKVSNIINNQSLTDAHTCYKVFRSDIFSKIKLQEKGFAFCPEVTTKIAKKNYLINEISISYNGRTYLEGKKINSFDGLIALYCLLKYRYFS